MVKKPIDFKKVLKAYIQAVLYNNTNEQKAQKKKLQELVSSPQQAEKLAIAARYIVNHSVSPTKMNKIISEVCQIPAISRQLETASHDSDEVAELWRKWCNPINEEISSDQTIDQMKGDAEKSAIEADLQKAKTKISRLEKENSSIGIEAGKDKLVTIISSIVPAVNELAMFIPAMQQAGIDPDALAGFTGALRTIFDAIADAGATMIDNIGDEVEFDPVKHHCMKHIAKGHPVIVESVGFMVDQDVVVPALVKELED